MRARTRFYDTTPIVFQTYRLTPQPPPPLSLLFRLFSRGYVRDWLRFNLGDLTCSNASVVESFSKSRPWVFHSEGPGLSWSRFYESLLDIGRKNKIKLKSEGKGANDKWWIKDRFIIIIIIIIIILLITSIN